MIYETTHNGDVSPNNYSISTYLFLQMNLRVMNHDYNPNYLIYLYLHIFAMKFDHQELLQLPKLSPSLFAYYVSRGQWRYAKHFGLIEEYIFKILRGEERFLIVNLPPRHGKSDFLSKYFPAWYLGNFPDKRVILSSYQASLSEGWSRKIRDILKEFGPPLFNIEINPNHHRANSFEILGHSGGLFSVGTGGAITGKGANIMIIDDPIKNDSEANSLTYRDKVFEWFNSTAFTRLEPDGAMILIMTRWNEDDLTGRLLNNNFATSGFQWQHINLPAIATENDQLGREVGQALWQERFDIDKLNQIKNSIGSYWFSSLYQQQPVPAGTSIFKRVWFQYFDEDDRNFIINEKDGRRKTISKSSSKIFSTVDLASSIKETADYTVILTFAQTNDNDILILDIIREKFEAAEHLNLIKYTYQKFKPILIGIESVQYQSALLQAALKEGLPIKSLKADKDKISRALPMASLLEAGKVYFKRNAHYLDAFESELLNFPRANHDDQVDAFAYIQQIISFSSGLLPL